MTPDSREARIEAEAVTEPGQRLQERALFAFSLTHLGADRELYVEAYCRGALDERRINGGADLRDLEEILGHVQTTVARHERKSLHDCRGCWDELAAYLSLSPARKARASNDSGAVEATLITATEPCARCSERVFVTMRGPMVPHQCWQRAPQPAPDRVSRIEELEGLLAIERANCESVVRREAPRVDRIEAALDLLFAGVTGLSGDWDRAKIAAKKAWNREGE